MFQDVGKKIQNISTTIFWILEIVTMICALAALMLFSGDGDSPLGFALELVILGFGSLFAWLSQLMLQAYGKITESCEVRLLSTKK
ncbi:MAG: hypothetical protein ACI3XD_01525 [Oscillospiraceae bacterium]